MSHAVDLEQCDGADRTHSRSIGGSDVSEEGSCDSQFFSTTGGSYDEFRFGFVVVSEASSESECGSAREGENGVCELKLCRLERDCRICHLGLESNSHESGPPIQLGCSCKDDLGSAHKNCAEAWFKIKRNRTCEICQSMACNVAELACEIEMAELANESHYAPAISASIAASDSRSFWHGHRFLNFLLACMVFAFVVSWLFHFNVSS